MTRKIIIDTDPGQDDAVAILLAFGASIPGAPDAELEVLGLTSVAGNVPLDYTTRNCLMLTELAERTDVGVHEGAVAPLQRKLVTAEHVHGPTGIDGIDRPDPTTPVASTNAAQFIVDTLMSTDDVTLCTLGPLTNIAEALAPGAEVVLHARSVAAGAAGRQFLDCLEACLGAPVAAASDPVGAPAVAVALPSAAAAGPCPSASVAATVVGDG